MRGSFRYALLSACVLVSCGGSAPDPAPPPTPSGEAAASPTDPPAASGDPAPASSGAASAVASGGPAAPPADSGAGNAFAAHVEEAKLGKELGAEHGKLLSIAKLSPKTHKHLVKNYIWTATSECKGQALVDVKPSPGLLVAAGKPIKVAAKAYENLKAAGKLAEQRGVAIEVVTGAISIDDAVKDWNRSILDAALRIIKAAPAGDQKEKSFAGEARKAIDDGDGPKSWTASPCESGRFGGWAVDVQLVSLDASGKRGQVLVKAGAEGDRFTQDTFEATYWDKPKGKSFRTLTEVMSAGAFVRRCSAAYHFTSGPSQDGTWRCKQDTESWDPPNRPLPAWQ